MSSIYCTECGTKIEYTGSKPKFCSNCGSSIPGGTTQNKKESKSSLSRKPQEHSIASDKEGTDYEHVPNVSKLDYEIEYGGSFGKTANLVDLLNEQEQAKKRN